MMRRLLLRGMLAGLLAGVVGFTIGHFIGEPAVNRAIAYESSVETHAEESPHHDATSDEPVSRDIQSTAGLGLGTILYGLALGGIFSIVFSIACGRIGLLTARGTSAVLGGAAFVAIYLVPVLKYPANPPAIGSADTITRRSTLYLVTILVSVFFMLGAFMARRSLVARLGAWNASIVAGVGYLAAVVLAYVVLPGINEVPQQAIAGVVSQVAHATVTFPPTVLWQFRMSGLAIQAAMWLTIALGFGFLAERLFAAQSRADAAFVRDGVSVGR